MHPLDEVTQHRFGDFEVGDHPVLHRTDRDDVARGSPEHLLRVPSHRTNLVGPSSVLYDGDDAGFGDYDALALCED